MSNFRPANEYKPGDILINYPSIEQKIAELALEIAKKYRGEKLLIVGILKGTFKLIADLGTKLHEAGLKNLEISFITVKSYADGTKADYEPKIIQDMDINPEGRRVLIVDDVLDTGRSIQVVHKLINDRNAISIESLVLVDKPERRQVKYKADYVGFTIPNVWVQGFGMDTNEIGRAEPNIIVGPYAYSD
jgi:hypoxanthine phosphoribosyltransferase